MAELQARHHVSERRACDALVFPRAVARYRSVKHPDLALRLRLRDLASFRMGYGYRQLHTLLAREGWRVNHKKLFRLYREEQLQANRQCLHRSAGGPRTRIIKVVVQSSDGNPRCVIGKHLLACSWRADNELDRSWRGDARAPHVYRSGDR